MGGRRLREAIDEMKDYFGDGDGWKFRQDQGGASGHGHGR